MALLLKIHGYYFSIEGKILFLDISDILNKRYSDKNSLDVETIINDITNTEYKAKLVKVMFIYPKIGALNHNKIVTSNCSNGEFIINIFIFLS